jgi:segregation and condensation protein A
MDETFKIKTEHFEGPLDLLLSLIEKRKFLVNDVSLAKVTDEYLKHVEALSTYSLSDRTDFILIASTLLLIKSRSLLPSLSLTEDEEGDIEDLQNRLKLYQKIKDLGVHISEIYGEKMIFFPNESKNMIKVFSPHESINLLSLSNALKDAIKRLPVKESPPQAKVKKVISLEEMIDRLTTRVKGALKMSFRDFSGNKRAVSREERVEVIVSFLAMLELVKQGVIDALQEGKHGDIKMETQELSTPRY